MKIHRTFTACTVIFICSLLTLVGCGNSNDNNKRVELKLIPDPCEMYLGEQVKLSIENYESLGNGKYNIAWLVNSEPIREGKSIYYYHNSLEIGEDVIEAIIYDEGNGGVEIVHLSRDCTIKPTLTETAPTTVIETDTPTSIPTQTATITPIPTIGPYISPTPNTPAITPTPTGDYPELEAFYDLCDEGEGKIRGTLFAIGGNGEYSYTPSKVFTTKRDYTITLMVSSGDGQQRFRALYIGIDEVFPACPTDPGPPDRPDDDGDDDGNPPPPPPDAEPF